jgi:hypothetical protein
MRIFLSFLVCYRFILFFIFFSFKKIKIHKITNNIQLIILWAWYSINNFVVLEDGWGKFTKIHVCNNLSNNNRRQLIPLESKSEF